MRDFIGRDDSFWSDPFPCELDALRLPKKGSRHRSTASLAEYDNHPTLPTPVGATPPVNTLFPQVGGPGMTTERCAINLDLAAQTDVPGQLRVRSLRSLYCCSDGVRCRGAAVTYLSHRASFHSIEWIAPSNLGIKHFNDVSPDDMAITIIYSVIEILAVRFLSTIFTISVCGVVVAALTPSLSDWHLLAVPCAMASALLLLKKWWQGADVNRNWIVIDGSNVMHWNDGIPKLETVREVVSTLAKAGLTPGVVFDANAGYKISGRYLHDKALGSLLGLSKDRVMVVPKGMPADPMILQVARDYGAMIVSNDRFRDWVNDYPDVLTSKDPVRGGYKDGKLWLSL